MSEAYWLPRVVKLELTYFEAGWLAAILHNNPSRATEMQPGPDGKPVLITFSEELFNRLNQTVAEAMKHD